MVMFWAGVRLRDGSSSRGYVISNERIEFEACSQDTFALDAVEWICGGLSRLHSLWTDMISTGRMAAPRLEASRPKQRPT
jgi:hypothetical protein